VSSLPTLRRLSGRIAAAVALAMPGLLIAQSAKDADLSALLKRQTQEFSEAGQRGDGATLARYLDDAVVFTNETGEIVTKKQLLEGVAPLPGERHIEVTQWSLTPQGNVATSTFIDVLQVQSHGQHLEYRFQSTETWAKRGAAWKMIASHTMVVPHDPPAVVLPGSDLDAYVGVYEADANFSAKITRDGDHLVLSSTGNPPITLMPEVRDVLYTPGDPYVRRIFERDGSGAIAGYVSRRAGTDLKFRKVG
jgi:ketosteroid isomerase-like protein